MVATDSPSILKQSKPEDRNEKKHTEAALSVALFFPFLTFANTASKSTETVCNAKYTFLDKSTDALVCIMDRMYH